MKLPQKQQSARRPLSIIALTLILVLSMTATSAASATVESSNGVATTQSYTYFSQVPNWAQSSVAKCLNNGLLNGTGKTNGVITLDLSQDFVRTIVLLDRAGYLGEANTQVKDEWIATTTPEATPEVTATVSQEDRTKPIYEVYKNGYHVEVPAETQWIIRDFAVKYGFDEKIIFGLALAESTFNPNCKGDSERSLGLYQIQRYWINGANIPHFTDDYKSRNLFDPHDATLTLMEMWLYAVDSYNIDITTEQGMKDLLYWHNTGKYKKDVNWSYSNKIFGFANELVALQD